MNTEVHISLYLDTRRIKKNGRYPVKLRVFCTIPRKQKLYQLNLDADEKVFNDAYYNPKTKKNIEFRKELNSIEEEVKNIVKTLKPFTFEAFEKKYQANMNLDILDVFSHYDTRINELNTNNQYGTASNYRLSKNSFIKYLDSKEKDSTRLFFSQIDKKWLDDYEMYMLSEIVEVDKDGNDKIKKKPATFTTISIYLRTLRTIFNNVIDNKEYNLVIEYPFGSKKYVIPSSNRVKKALNSDDLRKLFNSIPLTKEQEKAKDFWFLSYSCNGMNIKDIAQLKYKDLKDDSFSYIRAKTKTTSRIKQTDIKVYLNDYISNIIKKYGNKYEPNNYIFPIISKNASGIENFKAIKNFTKFINQNLKKMAIKNGITEEISTYWARHSFATNSVRNGASIEFVSEALNHKDKATTQSYFAGFESSVKKEFSKNLMNFK